MPLGFLNSDHLRRWWGGRPRRQAHDSSRKERDGGVPRGPGVRPQPDPMPVLSAPSRRLSDIWLKPAPLYCPSEVVHSILRVSIGAKVGPRGSHPGGGLLVKLAESGGDDLATLTIVEGSMVALFHQRGTIRLKGITRGGGEEMWGRREPAPREMRG
jgi:hypothetical protein